MTTRPISEARNADLRGSLPALQRAAQRARELATKTGTVLVISCRGVVEHLQPDEAASPLNVQEPSAPYDETP